MANPTERIKFAKALGKRIKAERKAQGISRYRLAEMSGVSDQQLRLYESGQQSPRSDVLERVLVSLGCGSLIKFSS